MTSLQRWLAGFIRRSPRTQAELAARLGISEKHLSQLVTGKEEGSLTMWQRILDELGVTL